MGAGGEKWGCVLLVIILVAVLGLGWESAVGALGCEMAFWPVMVVPLARETLMWCVKFVFMAGRTEVLLGTEQITERR